MFHKNIKLVLAALIIAFEFINSQKTTLEMEYSYYYSLPFYFLIF